MVSRKDKRKSGYVTPRATVSKKNLMRFDLFIEPYYDDWLDWRDGMRDWFRDFKKIKKLQKGDTKYRELEASLRETHLKRVKKEREESVATHTVHMELLDMLKQINVYLAEIAKTLLRAKK